MDVRQAGTGQAEWKTLNGRRARGSRRGITGVEGDAHASMPGSACRDGSEAADGTEL